MTWWTWRDVQGTVIDRVEGRLLDLSASGCRLETTSALEVGSMGVIEISDLPTPVAEAARVCRMTERPGAAARYVLQLEFLPLALAQRSPAHAAVAGANGSLPGHVLTGSGERSGSNPTTATVAFAGPASGVAAERENTPENAGIAAIDGSTDDLATTLNYLGSTGRGDNGRDRGCQREPSAFSGTNPIRADD